MNTCTICTHARQPHIDRLIASGRSLLSIHREIGATASYFALRRHVRNHLAPRGAPRSATPANGGHDAIAASGPSDPVASLRQQLADLEAMDPAKMSTNAALNLYEQRRRTASALASAAGPVAAPVIRMQDVEGMEEFVGILFDVLEPHLAIRLGLLARLEAAGLADLF